MRRRVFQTYCVNAQSRGPYSKGETACTGSCQDLRKTMAEQSRGVHGALYEDIGRASHRTPQLCMTP